MQMNHPDVALSGAPRAIEITPSLCSRPVLLVRSSAIAGKPSLARVGIHAGLDHLDLHRALRLVVHLHRAMPHAAVVVAGVDVAQEVRGRRRRLRLIDLDDDVAELGLHADADR